jgi:hypothetical protein
VYVPNYIISQHTFTAFEPSWALSSLSFGVLGALDPY